MGEFSASSHSLLILFPESLRIPQKPREGQISSPLGASFKDQAREERVTNSKPWEQADDINVGNGDVLEGTCPAERLQVITRKTTPLLTGPKKKKETKTKTIAARQAQGLSVFSPVPVRLMWKMGAVEKQAWV